MQQMGTMQQRTSGAWASPPWRWGLLDSGFGITKGLVLASVQAQGQTTGSWVPRA